MNEGNNKKPVQVTVNVSGDLNGFLRRNNLERINGFFGRSQQIKNDQQHEGQGMNQNSNSSGNQSSQKPVFTIQVDGQRRAILQVKKGSLKHNQNQNASLFNQGSYSLPNSNQNQQTTQENSIGNVLMPRDPRNLSQNFINYQGSNIVYNGNVNINNHQINYQNGQNRNAMNAGFYPQSQQNNLLNNPNSSGANISTNSSSNQPIILQQMTTKISPIKPQGDMHIKTQQEQQPKSTFKRDGSGMNLIKKNIFEFYKKPAEQSQEQANQQKQYQARKKIEKRKKQFKKLFLGDDVESQEGKKQSKDIKNQIQNNINRTQLFAGINPHVVQNNNDKVQQGLFNAIKAQYNGINLSSQLGQPIGGSNNLFTAPILAQNQSSINHNAQSNLNNPQKPIQSQFSHINIPHYQTSTSNPVVGQNIPPPPNFQNPHPQIQAQFIFNQQHQKQSTSLLQQNVCSTFQITPINVGNFNNININNNSNNFNNNSINLLNNPTTNGLQFSNPNQQQQTQAPTPTPTTNPNPVLLRNQHITLENQQLDSLIKKYNLDATTSYSANIKQENNLLFNGNGNSNNNQIANKPHHQAFTSLISQPYYQSSSLKTQQQGNGGGINHSYLFATIKGNGSSGSKKKKQLRVGATGNNSNNSIGQSNQSIFGNYGSGLGQNKNQTSNCSNTITSTNTNTNTNSIFSSIFKQKDPSKPTNSGNIFLQNNINDQNNVTQQTNIRQNENIHPIQNNQSHNLPPLNNKSHINNQSVCWNNSNNNTPILQLSDTQTNNVHSNQTQNKTQQNNKQPSLFNNYFGLQNNLLVNQNSFTHPQNCLRPEQNEIIRLFREYKIFTQREERQKEEKQLQLGLNLNKKKKNIKKRNDNNRSVYNYSHDYEYENEEGSQRKGSQHDSTQENKRKTVQKCIQQLQQLINCNIVNFNNNQNPEQQLNNNQEKQKNSSLSLDIFYQIINQRLFNQRKQQENKNQPQLNQGHEKQKEVRWLNSNTSVEIFLQALVGYQIRLIQELKDQVEVFVGYQEEESTNLSKCTYSNSFLNKLPTNGLIDKTTQITSGTLNSSMNQLYKDIYFQLYQTVSSIKSSQKSKILYDSNGQVILPSKSELNPNELFLFNFIQNCFKKSQQICNDPMYGYYHYDQMIQNTIKCGLWLQKFNKGGQVNNFNNPNNQNPNQINSNNQAILLTQRYPLKPLLDSIQTYLQQFQRTQLHLQQKVLMLLYDLFGKQYKPCGRFVNMNAFFQQKQKFIINKNQNLSSSSNGISNSGVEICRLYEHYQGVTKEEFMMFMDREMVEYDEFQSEYIMNDKFIKNGYGRQIKEMYEMVPSNRNLIKPQEKKIMIAYKNYPISEPEYKYTSAVINVAQEIRQRMGQSGGIQEFVQRFATQSEEKKGRDEMKQQQEYEENRISQNKSSGLFSFKFINQSQKIMSSIKQNKDRLAQLRRLNINPQVFTQLNNNNNISSQIHHQIDEQPINISQKLFNEFISIKNVLHDIEVCLQKMEFNLKCYFVQDEEIGMGQLRNSQRFGGIYLSMTQ